MRSDISVRTKHLRQPTFINTTYRLYVLNMSEMYCIMKQTNTHHYYIKHVECLYARIMTLFKSIILKTGNYSSKLFISLK